MDSKDKLNPGRHLGHVGYARIIRSLIDEPMTSVEAGLLHGVFGNTMRYLLKCMRQAGILHIVGWQRPVPNSIYVPVFAFGHGADVTRPVNRNGKVSAHRGDTTRLRIHSELVAFIGVIETLMAGAHTIRQVADETGIHYNLSRRLTRAMHGMGLVYIADWHRGEIGPYCAHFQFGLGQKDKRRPKAMTRSAIVAVSRRRRLAKDAQLLVSRALACNAFDFNQAQAA